MYIDNANIFKGINSVQTHILLNDHCVEKYKLVDSTCTQ